MIIFLRRFSCLFTFLLLSPERKNTVNIPEPTEKFETVLDISPAVLEKYGIRGIVTDLDDTLSEHGSPDPSGETVKWLEKMKEIKMPVCIVSNNTRRRTAPFADKIGVGYFCNAMKPSTRCVELALAVMGVERNEAVFVGDQLFTDVKTAHKAGIKSFLVRPVGNKTTLFIKLKRLVEARMTKEGK